MSRNGRVEDEGSMFVPVNVEGVLLTDITGSDSDLRLNNLR